MYFCTSQVVLPVDRQVGTAAREVTQIYEGTNQIQRMVMARNLLKS